MTIAVQEKRFDYKGFPCVILFMDHFDGFRCGYVGIPKENKLYKKPYNKIDIVCHGGLTYGCTELFHQHDNDIYWIGFDCNHGFDIGIKRTLEYCEEQCMLIVEQLIEMEGKNDRIHQN